MLFNLGIYSEGRWRKLRGLDYLAKVIIEVKLKDIEEVLTADRDAA